jgi:predicted HTH domain antitoxin
MPPRIRLQVPDEISAPAHKKAHEAAILTLWEEGELSASRAAEELGLSVHEYLDLLAARGLPVVRDFDPQAVEAAGRKIRAGKRP